MTITRVQTLTKLIAALQDYWQQQGCAIVQPYDLPMGAGTFHPGTFLRAIGPDPWHCGYVQACRRPTDGRYGENPNRLQHYYQFQVMLKPSPENIQQMYLDSLKVLGVDLQVHDIRFMEDDWESPTLGAWGLGWEVWLDGMEISQFTYFQQIGGLECRPVTGEITYGLERLAMYLQGVDSVFDLIWSEHNDVALKYGDLFWQNERQQSAYNFAIADVVVMEQRYTEYEEECMKLVAERLPIPAFDQVISASHVFNLLDSRHAISVTQRQDYILRTRKMAQSVAALQYELVVEDQ